MINKEHKDRLFKMLFGRPENSSWTLSLYNAVNGSSYNDPSQIEYNTMDDVLYMGMKNDLSFVLDMWLNLYGHQSTPCPNAPVRCFMYLGRLWAKLLVGRQNLYGKKLIKLAVPKCVVFYNGTEKEPEETELRLSDAFPEEKRDRADVELKVRMINVNSGQSKEILQNCRPLYEYSWLVDTIRKNHATMEIEEAVDKTLDEMPEEFDIRDFLLQHREEVCMRILTEYNEEETMRLFAEEAKEECREELNDLTLWLISLGRYDDLKRSAEDRTFQDALLDEMHNLKREDVSV